MHRQTADYINFAKHQLGNPHMSDRELGEHLGVAQPTVTNARHGKMSDPLAIKVADLIGVHCGEVLSVARASREKDERVRAELMDWVGKTLASISFEKAARPLLGTPVEMVASAQKALRAQEGAQASSNWRRR